MEELKLRMHVMREKLEIAQGSQVKMQRQPGSSVLKTFCVEKVAKSSTEQIQQVFNSSVWSSGQSPEP